MFYQIFLSPQVKRSAIITYKHGIYELAHGLPNDVRVVSSVELLGIQIDDKLNFNVDISNTCRPAANQLNVLIRPKRLLGPQEKRIPINSYFMANFNYCPLVRKPLSASSLKKIENLQKRAQIYL